MNFQVTLKDPADLAPNPKNPWIHPPAQRAAIRAALAEYGFLETVVWNSQTGHILDGHARVEEARELGLTEIPVFVVDASPEREAAMLAEINRTDELAEIDELKVNELLAEMESEGIEVPGLYRPDEPLDFSEGGNPGPVEPKATSPKSPPKFRTLPLLIPETEYEAFLARLDAFCGHYNAEGYPEVLAVIVKEAVSRGL